MFLMTRRPYQQLPVTRGRYQRAFTNVIKLAEHRKGSGAYQVKLRGVCRLVVRKTTMAVGGVAGKQ